MREWYRLYDEMYGAQNTMIAPVDKLKAYCGLGDMVPKGRLVELVGRGQERTMCWYSTMYPGIIWTTSSNEEAI